MSEKIKEEGVERCMSTNLINAKASIWFLDFKNDSINKRTSFVVRSTLDFWKK